MTSNDKRKPWLVDLPDDVARAVLKQGKAVGLEQIARNGVFSVPPPPLNRPTTLKPAPLLLPADALTVIARKIGTIRAMELLQLEMEGEDSRTVVTESGGIYEIDAPQHRVQRVAGSILGHRQRADDGEWRNYYEIIFARRDMFIVWSVHGEQADCTRETILR